MCGLSRSVVSDSLRPLWTIACQAPLFMGILQARILEWVAMPTSRGSSQPRDLTHTSLCLLHSQADSLPLVPPGKPQSYYPDLIPVTILIWTYKIYICLCNFFSFHKTDIKFHLLIFELFYSSNLKEVSYMFSCHWTFSYNILLREFHYIQRLA